MKKILFGIALILFSMLLHMTQIHLPFTRDVIGRGELAVLIAAVGLVIAGIGVCTKGK